MDLIKQILQISYKLGLSHIGSCISVLPILQEIYNQKEDNDLVILDSAHAHLAHLLFTHPLDAEKFIKEDIHCNRKAGCDVMGGSLGHGLGLGIGLALADRERTIYVIVSDGSMMEGSNWEALRIKTDLGLDNLKIYANFNGFTATRKIDVEKLGSRMKSFDPTIQFRLTNNKGIKCLQGVDAHYKVLSQEEYMQALKDVEAYDLADSLPGV